VNNKLAKKEGIPDMAELRIPSPINMQVPTRTRIRMALFYDSCSCMPNS
jgi:hypothetical protein